MRRLGLLLLLALSAVAPAVATEAPLRTGREAMGDWTSDAPGVRRRITVADLPPPNDTRSADNGPTMVARPQGAQLRVPPGFQIEEYASGLRDSRFLSVAPNGDLFVTESRRNEIRVLRDTNGDGKPGSNQSSPTAN